MINTLDRISICVKLKMDAAHRIFGHESKCKHIHGHEYRFEVHCTAAETDHLDRVVDFSVVKQKVGAWIDNYWDHGMLLCGDDPLVTEWTDFDGAAFGMKFFVMEGNPTAENIASHLKQIGNELMKPYSIRITKVVCHETTNCSAVAED